MITRLAFLFPAGGAVAGRNYQGGGDGGNHHGVGVHTSFSSFCFASSDSPPFRAVCLVEGWRESEVWRRAATFTHTFSRCCWRVFNFFTLVVIHSRRSWSVSSLWKCFFSISSQWRQMSEVPHNLTVSSLRLCFLLFPVFSSALSLSPRASFSSRRCALVQVHIGQHGKQELRKRPPSPCKLYSK